jgi:hypothetical protein
LADAVARGGKASLVPQELVESLLAVTPHLPPDQARSLLEGTATQLAEALNKAVPAFKKDMTEGLLMVVTKLPPETAANFLESVASQVVVQIGDPPGSPAQQLLADRLADRLAMFIDNTSPEQAASWLVVTISRCPHTNAERPLTESYRKTLDRLDLPAIVELMKHPLCVGSLRSLALQRAEQVAGTPFKSRWEFVEWLRQRHPEIDLSAPPKYLQKDKV